tara:strand:+ start:658 stop:1086 length:429 start_codon:yes stop_codon:yes gene_type:complete
MKSLLIAMSFVIASASFGRTVMYSVDTDGVSAFHVRRVSNPQNVSIVAPFSYPIGTVFPAVDPRYWKLSGKNWVEMSQSQKDKVDSAAKAEIVDAVNTDASLDALIKVIADLHNLSEKQVKDRMVAKIGKDKAHKAKKNRGN